MLIDMARKTKQMGRKARRRAFSLATHPAQRIKLMGPLLHPYWRMQFHSFGAGSVCHKPFWLEGANKIAVGDDTMLIGVWLGVTGKAWGKPDPEPALRIGSNVVIFPYSRIIAFESVVIEDHVAIACNVGIGDAEHTKAGSWDSFTQGPLDTAPTRIGRGTLLGERVSVLKGSNIGKSCFIGTNAVVQGRIPDYSIAIGAPARVIGRTRGARTSAGVGVSPETVVP
jgi:acetyltransferase-like isoleucine patch superfamily enzyme